VLVTTVCQEKMEDIVEQGRLLNRCDGEMGKADEVFMECNLQKLRHLTRSTFALAPVVYYIDYRFLDPPDPIRSIAH
jgi:hypothetical protein